MADSFDPGLIPLFTVQYSTALELLLQQRRSKLRGTVREGSFVGKMASPINQVGATTMKAPTGRFAPIAAETPYLTRRWLFPQPFEKAVLVDSFDQLQTVVDPKGEFVDSVAAAYGRTIDDVIIAAATGTAQIGVDQTGFNQEQFATSNFQVAVNFRSAAASGLIIDKAIEAQRILMHFHNDLEMEPPTLVIGSQQWSDLGNQVQITNALYSGDRAQGGFIQSGQIPGLLGCNIVVSERLPYSVGAANQRGVLMYVKSGIHLGTWKEMENTIDVRPDISSRPWQLSTRGMMGAARMQAGKVVQILCSDSTGADITP